MNVALCKNFIHLCFFSLFWLYASGILLSMCISCQMCSTCSIDAVKNKCLWLSYHHIYSPIPFITWFLVYIRFGWHFRFRSVSLVLFVPCPSRTFIYIGIVLIWTQKYDKVFIQFERVIRYTQTDYNIWKLFKYFGCSHMSPFKRLFDFFFIFLRRCDTYCILRENFKRKSCKRLSRWMTRPQT